jgi:hypothetical protein
MTTEERLVADFGGTGLTMEPHLMSYHRADMNRAGVTPAGCPSGNGISGNSRKSLDLCAPLVRVCNAHQK